MIQERAKMAKYVYSAKELKVAASPHEEKSKFDSHLCALWDKAMKDGHFRYDLSEVKTRKLSGPHKYVGLLNVKRATERRAPQPMQNVNQLFDETKFNFNKVKEDEILFSLDNSDRNTSSDDKVMINVSPADYCHSLIVPEIDLNHNQNLSLHSLILSLEMICLSSCRSFRIGFNSLCAHASVNHQHLHCYYTDEVLLCESLTASHRGDGLHILNSDAPTGYGFQLNKVEDIPTVAFKIYTCTDYMRQSDIAHCLFITRGETFSQSEADSAVIRILLWPRTKVLGPKPSEAAFNTAVLEMAGHLLVKDSDYYESLTDQTAYQCLRDVSLPHQEFSTLTDTLISKLATNHTL